MDFARRKVTIDNRSKNGKVRHLPLNVEALAAFRELYAKSLLQGKVFVAAKGGKPLVNYRHWFPDVVEEAGLRDGFTWYSLRHTFATRLIMAGVSLRVVQELMGHSNLQLLKRYAHVSDDQCEAAVARLATLDFSGPADTDTSTDTSTQSHEVANGEAVTIQ